MWFIRTFQFWLVTLVWMVKRGLTCSSKGWWASLQKEDYDHTSQMLVHGGAQVLIQTNLTPNNQWNFVPSVNLDTMTYAIVRLWTLPGPSWDTEAMGSEALPSLWARLCMTCSNWEIEFSPLPLSYTPEQLERIEEHCTYCTPKTLSRQGANAQH